MGYVHDSLLKDEEVVFTTKNHPIIFLWPVIILAFGLLMALSIGSTKAIAGSGATSGGSAAGPFLIVGAVWFILALMRYNSNEFAVTNKRVIIKEGIFKKITLEMNKDKIESLIVNQSLLGGMLNYGTLIVSGTGATKQPFKEIADPMKFKKIVQEAS